MARGRAWGNALGGYKTQRRKSNGQFGSGKAGKRAAVRRISKNKKVRRVAVGVGVVAVVGVAAYAGYNHLGKGGQLPNARHMQRKFDNRAASKAARRNPNSQYNRIKRRDAQRAKNHKASAKGLANSAMNQKALQARMKLLARKQAAQRRRVKTMSTRSANRVMKRRANSFPQYATYDKNGVVLNMSSQRYRFR